MNMKNTILILMGLLVSAGAYASSTTVDCKSLGDDRDITVIFSGNDATIIGYWQAGEKDTGTRIKDTAYGQYAYAGFPIYTDDGQNGQMYVDKALFKTGRGKISLQNYYCEDNCSLRRNPYSCKVAK